MTSPHAVRETSDFPYRRLTNRIANGQKFWVKYLRLRKWYASKHSQTLFKESSLGSVFKPSGRPVRLNLGVYEKTTPVGSPGQVSHYVVRKDVEAKPHGKNKKHKWNRPLSWEILSLILMKSTHPTPPHRLAVSARNRVPQHLGKKHSLKSWLGRLPLNLIDRKSNGPSAACQNEPTLAAHCKYPIH